MDQLKEIRELKIIIEKKKSNINDIKELVKHEIDDDFSDLSEERFNSESINFMNKTLKVMSNLSDPRPVSEDIQSHRKKSGFFIILAKKITMKVMTLYTNLLMDRQKIFNENNMNFNTYSFENQNQFDNRLTVIEEKLSEIEGSIEGLDSKLERIFKDLDKKP